MMILKLRSHDRGDCSIPPISFLTLSRLLLLFRIADLVRSGWCWWLIPGISRLHVNYEQRARLQPLATCAAVFKFVRLAHTWQRRSTSLVLLVYWAEQLRPLTPLDPRYGTARFTSAHNFHSGNRGTLLWRRWEDDWYCWNLTGQFLFRCIRYRTIQLVPCRSRTKIG